MHLQCMVSILPIHHRHLLKYMLLWANQRQVHFPVEQERLEWVEGFVGMIVRAVGAHETFRNEHRQLDVLTDILLLMVMMGGELFHTSDSFEDWMKVS